MSTFEETSDATEVRRWQSFRYVAGEMSAPEAAEFEACLADDESLCATVAETVRLLDAVAIAAGRTNSVPPSPLQPQKSGSRRRAAVVAAVIASALAVAAVFLLPGGFDPARQAVQQEDNGAHDRPVADRPDAIPSHDTTPGVELPERLPERLLAAWNDSALLLGQDADDAASSLGDGLILSEADETVEPDRGGDETGPAAFGWMLAAVSDDAESDAPQDDDKTWDN